MKYIKNQFAKVVFLFLVISLIVTGMLKLADHDFIYSLSILFGCSSPAPLTLKICFFMFVILAQYFNADGFIFYIKNIDYLLIRYRSKYQTLRSLLNIAPAFLCGVSVDFLDAAAVQTEPHENMGPIRLFSQFDRHC